jgi:hypothetical protein
MSHTPGATGLFSGNVVSLSDLADSIGESEIEQDICEKVLANWIAFLREETVSWAQEHRPFRDALINGGAVLSLNSILVPFAPFELSKGELGRHLARLCDEPYEVICQTLTKVGRKLRSIGIEERPVPFVPLGRFEVENRGSDWVFRVHLRHDFLLPVSDELIEDNCLMV